MKRYDILCVGNYTKDTVVTPAGARTVDGGAVNYAAHAAARLGLRVAVVTRLARADQHVLDRLTESGIDCYAGYSNQSTLLRLEYPTTDPDLRTLYINGEAGAISAEDVGNLDARAAVIGASLRGEVGLDVIRALKEKKMRVAADMQGFVRVQRAGALKYEQWDEMAATLAMIDVVKSDAVEAEFLTGERDIHKAARFYAGLGPHEIVLTHRDGLLIYADERYYEMEFHPSRLDGRSGRGDTCLGTYMAMRLSRPPREAGIWAAAVTSLKMEKPGPFDRSLDEVADLIQARYNNVPLGGQETPR